MPRGRRAAPLLLGGGVAVLIAATLVTSGLASPGRNPRASASGHARHTRHATTHPKHARGGRAGLRMRAAMALLVLALTLTGCETNEERHAELVRQDRYRAAPVQSGLDIGRASSDVKVLATTVLHDENGVAAVVRLRNDSSRPLREVPIAITLREPGGRTLYQNNVPGLSSPLTHAPLLQPGKSFEWVDDQIPASGTPGSLSARVGEAPAAGAHPPSLTVRGVHVVDDPTNGVGAEGTVVNRSAVAQQELVVFAVATRAGRIVAAGRAVLPDAWVRGARQRPRAHLATAHAPRESGPRHRQLAVLDAAARASGSRSADRPRVQLRGSPGSPSAGRSASGNTMSSAHRARPRSPPFSPPRADIDRRRGGES